MKRAGVALVLGLTASFVGADDPPKRISLDLGKGVKLELVLIPAGSFTMGSPESEPGRNPRLPEGPRHKVTISRPFYMGIHEVTQEQYQAVTGTNPTPKEFRRPEHPVECINWPRAMAFVRRASEKTGMTVRLPTEAEWEYACRAGTTTTYFFGDDRKQLDHYAWTPRNSKLDGRPTTHPVGKLKPNPWGLYDVYGNVFEFCSDNFREDWRYPAEAVTDPRGAPEAEKRKRKVLRGGAFNMGGSWCRSAARCWGPLTTTGRNHGMRVVVEVPQAANQAGPPARRAGSARPTGPARRGDRGSRR